MNQRIAIVAEWLTSRGGAESVIFELAKIFPDADIFSTVYNKDLFPELKDRKITASFLQNIPILNKKHQFAFFLLPRAIESLDLRGYDVVISSSSAFGKGARKDTGATHICYCHTPMRWVWEPKRDSRLSRIPFSSFVMRSFKKWDLKTNRGVDIFIANSQNTANKIKRFYNIDAQVVYPPVEIDTLKNNKSDTPKEKDYYFSISRLIPYKRIDIAIKACEKLNKKLYIAGSGPQDKYLRQIAGKNTEFLGRVSSKEKLRLYKNAKATIFCADEDFGIVPVESLASGTPVIAYRGGGALEIVDESNGVFFDRQSSDSLAKAIENFEKLSFDKQYLEQSVKKFDRIHFKRNILKIIENIGS